MPFCCTPISAEKGFSHGAREEKYVALTFDDGPHPRYTPKILEILEEYGIKATFFVVGVNAENYPDTIEKVIKAGHEIGNHTYSHPHVSWALSPWGLPIS